MAAEVPADSERGGHQHLHDGDGNHRCEYGNQSRLWMPFSCREQLVMLGNGACCSECRRRGRSACSFFDLRSLLGSVIDEFA